MTIFFGSAVASFVQVAVASVTIILLAGSNARAGDLPVPAPIEPSFLALANPSEKANGVVVFGGPLSTRALKSTLMFDLDYSVGQGKGMNYDNYFVGAAYDRDFWHPGYGFTLGAEVGIGDRFGHYYICCDLVIKSASILNSPEVWAGPRVSFDGIVIGNTVRVAAAATFGFSFAASALGREREAVYVWDGNAQFLFYMGPELSLSLVDHPDWELVSRVQHRSGGGGMLGKIREGYNANTVGLRYKF
jgi:hypothetical protein